jgi:dephospho-CoA kinase
MKLFGLTGGVGMGKSSIGDLLLQRGVPVIDTDRIARQLVEPGQPALQEIRRAFGDRFVASTGGLRRDRLADHVFQRPAARRQLEAILHPPIRAAWLAEVESWRAAPYVSGAVLIPLLFETEAASAFDATLCVACSAVTQRRRLAARGWGTEQIEQRLRAQWPIEKKIATADFVIWSEGDLRSCAEQLERIPGLLPV